MADATAELLTAVATHPGTSEAVLRALADHTRHGGPAVGPLAAAVAAHPNLPKDAAAEFAGLTRGLVNAAALSGYLRRPDPSQADLRGVRMLAACSAQGRDQLDVLADHPDTPEAVLTALVPHIGVRGAWCVPNLLTHPNCGPQTAVAVFTRLSRGLAPYDPPHTRSGCNLGYLKTLTQGMNDAAAGAVLDQLAHPAMLMLVADGFPALLTDHRLTRLARVIITESRTLVRGNVTKTHPLARAVALVRAHADLPLRQECAAALTAAGTTIIKQDPAAALDLGAAPETKGVGHRRWRALSTAARTDRAVVDAVAAELHDLVTGPGGPDALPVLLTIAETIDAPLDDLLTSAAASTRRT